MTLKDLIETCPFITALEIEIRDNGVFIQRYRLGYGACFSKYEDAYQLRQFPTECDPTPINYYDDDRTGPWGVKTKAIPKQLLDMQVDYWRPTYLFEKRSDSEIKLVVTLYPEGKSLPKPKKAKAAPAAGDPAQMSIEEWMKNGEWVI